MDRALAITMQEQHSDVINQDTIRIFNSHLQIAALRGKATLAVDTRSSQFKAYAHCSETTIFSLSDQRPAALLWVLTGFWAMFMWYRNHGDRLLDSGQNHEPVPVIPEGAGNQRRNFYIFLCATKTFRAKYLQVSQKKTTFATNY